MEEDETWQSLADELVGKAELTSLEVARDAGVDPVTARRLWQALGFPPAGDDEQLFTRTDSEILRAVRALVEHQGADPGDVLQLTRVIGQSLARVAEAQMTIIGERLQRTQGAEAEAEGATEAGEAGKGGEAAVAEGGGGAGDSGAAPAGVAAAPPRAVAALGERVRALAPGLEQFLGYVWRRHLLAALHRTSVVPSATDRVLTVGFADLVGFTALSEVLDTPDLATVMARFEAAIYDTVPERGGRVVKMIGDEVLFAVDDATTAADIALALLEAHVGDPRLPGLRVGLARGPILPWQGDLLGPTVNLASRLVAFARPNTIVMDDGLGAELEADPRFALKHLRAVKLQGIGRVRSWVLRRARDAGTHA